MTRSLISVILALICTCHIGAQSFLTPSTSFSHKKTSYITMSDGTELKGVIKDLDRKKGLIEQVKIEDGNGDKHKIKPEDIDYMYLPPSGLDKLGNALDFLEDAQKWTDDKLDQDLLHQGYVYFENAKVKIKRKEMMLLMQLLNPTFSKVVKVYHDPKAGETTAVGIGGVTLHGGDAKSYFIKFGDDVAFNLHKRDYKNEFVPLWDKCNVLIEKFPSPDWPDLAQHVFEYSECVAQ